ncbi:MAG TPA: GGDEF domain-containing protein [Planctomycetota bacterium]|nr:GGDEF domain-containing protein [Planctomycetota bacterium]
MQRRPEQPVQDAERELFSLAQIMHLLRIEFARAQRYEYPLSCLLIAVDGLGHIRDTYGYEAKQSVLDEVAGALQAETRSCDFLGRLMDDRLLAVVPHTMRDGARVLAERLLAAVRKLRFESGGDRVPITLSIGVTHNGAGSTLFFDALLQAGEGALAESVVAGGDRLSVRDPDPLVG